jgi:hypothetical protein
LTALVAAVGFLVVGLGIRLLAGHGGVLDGSGPWAQYSGTALYAAMIYAGVFLLVPGAEPWVAGVAAVAFCWLVEVLQLTGLPAELSERSLLARLVLGVHFDALDLLWYAIGVLPLVVLHAVLVRHRR